MSVSTETKAPVREESYLRRLLPMLGAATFFQGYAAAVPVVVQPGVAADLELGPDQLTWAILLIGAGSVVGFLVAPLADRFGRSRALILTTLLFAGLTALMGASRSAAWFAVFGFLARALVIGAYAAAVTIAVEEFPAGRRGWAVGVISGTAGIGLAAAGGAQRLIGGGAGWRLTCLLALAAAVPAVWMSRRLEETARWRETHRGGLRGARLFGPHTPQLIQLGAAFFFAYFAFMAGATWWGRFAEIERGMAPATIEVFITAAYLTGVAGYFAGGWVQDRLGRRRAGTYLLLAAGALGAGALQVEAPLATLLLMSLAVFFALGASSVLSALSAELFPLRARAASVGFLRAVFGTAGAILGPFSVGMLSGGAIGAVGTIEDALTIVLAMVIPAALLLRLLPETASRELETISAAAGIPPSPGVSTLVVTHPEPRSDLPSPRRVEGPGGGREQRPGD